jgi:hypothetical protein
MKKLRIIFMSLLISVTHLQNSLAQGAGPEQGDSRPQVESCEEIETACIEVINKAEEFIKAQNAEILFLKDTQKELMSRLETQEKIILDAANPPWYSTPTTMLLIGVITGGLLYGKVSSK